MPSFLVFLLSCADNIDLEACDTSAAASVNVSLVDEAGAALSSASVTYTVDDGGETACESMGNAGSWACGWEVAGHFVITAASDGYVEQTEEVDVAQGECHVESQSVTMTMHTEDCSGNRVAAVVVTVTTTDGADPEALDVEWRSRETSTSTYDDCDSSSGNWDCGWNETGSIEVQASAAGYYRVSQVVEVPVSDDGCHPTPQFVTLELEPDGA